MTLHVPKAAKGSMRTIEVACVGWIDLLGYGAMLEKSSFDLLDPVAELAIERLHYFHEIVGKRSCRFMPTFVMNDGAVAYRDMSPRARSVTYDFLSRCIDLFSEINEVDQKKLGQPGARMVIASGFRARRKINFEGHLNSGLAKKIRDKVEQNKMPITQGINEALKARQTYDAVPELQANFALTKAYLADSSGSKAGLGGPNCYIDLSLFGNQPPRWIEFSEVVDWKSRGITCRFGKLIDINKDEAGKTKYSGILDAFEIAEKISSHTNASNLLKEKRIVNSHLR